MVTRTLVGNISREAMTPPGNIFHEAMRQLNPRPPSADHIFRVLRGRLLNLYRHQSRGALTLGADHQFNRVATARVT